MFSLYKYNKQEENLNKVKGFLDTKLPDYCKNGHYLILRTSQYGLFWGCSHYPQCKQTKKFKEGDKEISLKYL